MLTIHAKTKAVENKHEHPQVLVKTPWGIMNQTPGYVRGWLEPRHPVPAIRQGIEPGMCLNDNSFVWLFWKQEAYDG